MVLNHYVAFLEKELTPHRLQHSLGVMQVMSELAEIYDLDPIKAGTIGLLHDAAKDLPPHRYQQLISEGNIPISHECELDYNFYLHAPVGAYLVQKELAVQDEEVLAAITTHTYYGNNHYFNAPLSWCVRFADILEPNRRWGGEEIIFKAVDGLRRLAYSGQLETAAWFQTGIIIKWFETKGFPIHPNMRSVKETLATKLNLDDSHLDIDLSDLFSG